MGILYYYENMWGRTCLSIIRLPIADYKEMQEMFFCEYPDFDKIIDVLRKLEDELHNL